MFDIARLIYMANSGKTRRRRRLEFHQFVVRACLTKRRENEETMIERRNKNVFGLVYQRIEKVIIDL